MGHWSARALAVVFAVSTSNLGAQTITFVSDRDGNREVYAMGEDGAGQINLTRNPARDQAPAVSPDGRSIAWISDRSGQLGIWLMAGDGSSQRLLLEVPNADFGIAWSPDGERLALTLQDPSNGSHDLAVLEIGSRELVHLSRTPLEEEVTPAWGPSGEGLYYVAGSGQSTVLRRMDVESGQHDVIKSGLMSVSFPVPSSDGTRVLLRSRTDQFDVLLLDVETGAVENLTRHPANDWGATWSRDGRSVTFASDRDGDMDIYTLDLESRVLTQLTENEDRDWSPSR